MLAPGVASAMLLRCLLVLWALCATPAAADRGKLSEKAANRAAQAAGVSARQRQSVAQLMSFLSEVQDLHGHHGSHARIEALARSLETKDCRYDKELDDTKAAVKLFTECIAQIQGIANKTLESADMRGRLNLEYGKASEVSLDRVKSTIQHLNHLQRSIVVEHKNAADHLAQEILAIKGQVSQIWSTNEDAKKGKGKGWVSDKSKSDESDVDSTPKVTGDSGFQKTVTGEVVQEVINKPVKDDKATFAQISNEDRPKLEGKDFALSQMSTEDRDGPVIVKAEHSDADSEEPVHARQRQASGGVLEHSDADSEEPVHARQRQAFVQALGGVLEHSDADSEEGPTGSGGTLAELKQELHLVQAKLAEAKHRSAHDASEEES